MLLVSAKGLGSVKLRRKPSPIVKSIELLKRKLYCNGILAIETTKRYCFTKHTIKTISNKFACLLHSKILLHNTKHERKDHEERKCYAKIDHDSDRNAVQ